mgnify:FL=1
MADNNRGLLHGISRDGDALDPVVIGEAANPFPGWARRPPVLWLWYIRSRIGDHGRMPPIRRLTEITSLIYVGGQTDQHGWSRLQRWGVGALVNVRVEWDDRRLSIQTPHYLWLPAIDGTPLSVEQLTQGVAFIAEQLAARRGVYIHCAAGLGRGPMMAAAFFVARGLHAEEAIAFVGARRPFISLSKRQRARLRDFESYLHNGGTVSSAEWFTRTPLPLRGGEARG